MPSNDFKPPGLVKPINPITSTTPGPKLAPSGLGGLKRNRGGKRKTHRKTHKKTHRKTHRKSRRN